MRCWMRLLVLSPGCTWETPGSSYTWIHLTPAELESLQWCPSTGIYFKAPQVIVKNQVIYASKSPHSAFQHFFSLITLCPIHERGELVIHSTSEELWSPPPRLSGWLKKKKKKLTNQSTHVFRFFWKWDFKTVVSGNLLPYTSQHSIFEHFQGRC